MHVVPHHGPRRCVVEREPVPSPMPRRPRTPNGGRYVRIMLDCGHERIAREQWSGKRFGYCAECVA